MGVNDLWGKFYNLSLINDYWKAGIRSQPIYYSKDKQFLRWALSVYFTPANTNPSLKSEFARNPQ